MATLRIKVVRVTAREIDTLERNWNSWNRHAVEREGDVLHVVTDASPPVSIDYVLKEE